MSTYTVTIDVDPAPRLAYLTYARAVVDSTGTVVLTTAPVSVPIVAGGGTFRLEADVVYRLRYDGVPGLAEPVHVAHDADCTDAQLRQDHQVDPATLQPLDPAETAAELILALTARTAALEAITTIADTGDGTATIG